VLTFASSWIADGIVPAHCIDVIDRHLLEHAANRRSGSADGLLPYLDKLIRFEWNQTTGRAQRRQERREVPRHGSSLDEYITRSRAPRILDDWLGIAIEADWEGDY
jgi:hypothetical protein